MSLGPPGVEDTVAASSAPGSVAKGPQSSTFSPGTRIRQYEIIRELGRGGMGRVYLARDTKLARRVAMKFLSTGSPELTARFLAEARTTARCNHENIVVIHEVDEHEGAPYMVLEYLEGHSLRHFLEDKRLTASRAVELMVPVVRALVCAHEFGITHRDLKPENIRVTASGGIKVLDFGIAKLFGSGERAPLGREDDHDHDLRLTGEGAIVGTLPYMSPEQLGLDELDHRTDLYAVGVMLFEMVAGRHPLAPFTAQSLLTHASRLDDPLPRVGSVVTDLPERLERVIDRCLAKRKGARHASAQELLVELEALLPGRVGRLLAEDESPYPGLAAFQEGDADRFFGRNHDVARTVARLRDLPLAAVVGPSGVGKSSFVRAGVVPALKASGDAWECYLLRPGRTPLASLASLLLPLASTSSGEASKNTLVDHEAVLARLQAEPGYLGTLLRARAARKACRILLFVDQFEELYTLVASPAERHMFTACLSGVADDAAAPLRIVVSVRSDFLDRVGEDRVFLDELTRGLVFLQPLGRAGLREALVQPLDVRGYRFEAEGMVERMLDALESTPGALPLLQFTAARLWDARDRKDKLLSQASYDAMGGVSGTLASHADHVLTGLAAPAQRIVRAVFQRLVTPERTRAIVDLRELRELSSEPREVDTTVDRLVEARLLVVQGAGEREGGTVEIVHESLITSWPTLRRWLDESQEDSTFLAQLRAAAKQWDQKGRPQGLLWRGEAMEEARLWNTRYRGELPPRDRAFLSAVFALASRATRVRRAVVAGVIAVLSLLVAAGAVTLVKISRAETAARKEAERARAAEQTVQRQLDELEAGQRAKQRAEKEAREKGAEAEMSRAELEVALARTREEKARAEKERENARELARKAEEAARREAEARAEAQRLYQEARARAEQLEKERKRITTDLPK